MGGEKIKIANFLDPLSTITFPMSVSTSLMFIQPHAPTAVISNAKNCPKCPSAGASKGSPTGDDPLVYIRLPS